MSKDLEVLIRVSLEDEQAKPFYPLPGEKAAVVRLTKRGLLHSCGGMAPGCYVRTKAGEALVELMDRSVSS